MALATGIVWEVRGGTGSDNNGGGFKAGASGTDRSQQAGAHATLTILSLVHTTTTQINVSALDYTVAAADVGNILQITGGSATAGFYEITAADTVNNRWTLDRSAGTAGQTVVGAMGGALNTLTKVASPVVAGNTVYVKSATYAETLTLTKSGNGTNAITWVGYSASRNDNPVGTGRPLIDGASTRANCIDVAATQGNIFKYFRVSAGTGDNITWSSASNDAGATFYYVKSSSAGSDGVGPGASTSGRFKWVACEFNSCTATGMNITAGHALIGCYSHDNTSNGFTSGGGNMFAFFCIADTNSATGFLTNNSASNNTGPQIINCTSYGNTGASSDGFSNAENATGQGQFAMFANCISKDNGRDGFRRNAGTILTAVVHCCAHGNSGTAFNGGFVEIGSVTTDPTFTDAANGDFSVGTNMKAAGYPGVFPAELSTGYLDIGAVQRSEPQTPPRVDSAMVGGMRG